MPGPVVTLLAFVSDGGKMHKYKLKRDSVLTSYLYVHENVFPRHIIAKDDGSNTASLDRAT